MNARHCLPIVLLASSALAFADFVPDDVIVSDPNSDLIQPEFDFATHRIIWQDQANRLWIGNVDPVTGDLVPMNGKGTLLDTGLAPAGQVGNTPRYTYGSDQAAIVYTKSLSGVFYLAKALEVAPDSWVASVLDQGDGRWKPNGTPEETTDLARIVYNRSTPQGTVVSWRTLDDPTSEQTADVIAQGGRFLGAEPAVLVFNKDASHVTQVFEVPFATGQPEQITFGPDDKLNPFIWWSPEYQDYLFVVMLNFRELAVYRRIDGVWTNIYQFLIPSAKPLLSSPEVFVNNGRSILAVVTCDQLGSGGFVGQPVGPSEIWIAGLDPTAPFFRRIDDPSYAAQRSEPEPFALQSEHVVYYTELQTPSNRRLLKRARTGLAEDSGYDLTSYGGPWSSSLRDNKNCACTPYTISDHYTRGPDIPLNNTQVTHATLGPEDQMYFTINAAPPGSPSYLVAVDSTTGAERYRLDERTATSKLAATDALIDQNGYYYLPANEALGKYTSAGVQQWRVPTRGLSRGAQFLPDGNVLFFTWNGWVYVVSPDGVVLLERNLTPGRIYPAQPSCLGTGPLGNDCAYASPPAIDGATGRIYVTQLRARGDSVLQAFKYNTVPNVDLRSVWAARSPVLPGVSTGPVLGPVYNRVYVHDGAGNLRAFRAQTGAQAWSFPLGFRSNQSPTVSDSSYLMPGGNVDEDPAHSFVAIVRDLGTSAQWAVQSSAYAPKSSAAAGASDRFVLLARDNANESLNVLVATPAGVVSATPLSGGIVPTTLRGVTLRDDGWIFVQTSGQGVISFHPAP